MPVSNPDVPGKYRRAYTINVNSLIDFEPIKVDLMGIESVEDVLLDESASLTEMIVLTDGTVPDARIQQTVAQHGFNAIPITPFIA